MPLLLPILRVTGIALLHALGAGSLANATAPPDTFSQPIPIGQGEMPSLAIDANSSLHLIYTRSGTLFYKAGSLSGVFGDEESIFEDQSFNDPRIALDSQNRPHVVVANGNYKNRFTYYTNTIAAKRKPPLDVFDKDRDNLNRATMPSLLLEPSGSALVGAFTVGDASGTTSQWGALARIKNLDTIPKVSARRKIDVWNPQLLAKDGELWVGGRNKVMGARRFTFQRHNMHTLDEEGSPLRASGAVHGEVARAVVGKSGELHAAGTINHAPAKQRAWYNTLTRAKAGLPPIHYQTSLANPSGAGIPVEDEKTPSRIYIFHWSHITGDAEHHEHKDCLESEQLHFVRIEDGHKVSEMNRVTYRENGHGPHYRCTPAAIAHPEGGALVVFRECDGHLFLTRIGG